MGKRSNGEGTIYFNEKRQRWEAQSTYTDEFGRSKRKLFTGKNQKDANQKRLDWQKELDKGLLPEAGKLLLVTWIDKWLSDFVKPKVKIRTWEKYNASMKYVKRRFPDTLITKITVIEMQKFLNELLVSGRLEGTGLAPVTVRNVRRYLISCLDKALAIGLITKNVVRMTDSPKMHKEEIQPLTEEQISKLLAVAKEGEYIFVDTKQRQEPSIDNLYLQLAAYNIVMVALNTGMRIGEVLGLKWSDVRFQNKIIHVQRSLSATATQGLLLEEPKTKGSRRQIPVSAHVIESLQKFKKEQERFAEQIGYRFDNEENLVFCNSFGNLMKPSNFSSRYFKKMLKLADIDSSFTFHDLRHTHATLLLQKGINIKVISARLGHSSITITLDTYAHLMPTMQEIAVTVLDKLEMY